MAAGTPYIRCHLLLSFSRIPRNCGGDLINSCGLIAPSVTRRLSDNVSSTQEKRNGGKTSHINCAALERGVTKYYCNRNPRSLELMGMADKPRGFGTKNQRMDYYHRYV